VLQNFTLNGLFCFCFSGTPTESLRVYKEQLRNAHHLLSSVRQVSAHCSD